MSLVTTIGPQAGTFPCDYTTTLKLAPDDILSSVLPEELIEGKPSGFDIVGHVGETCDSHPFTRPCLLTDIQHI